MTPRLLAPALALALLGCEGQPDSLAAATAPTAHAAAEVETWIPEEDECGECHDAIAEQWSRSRHHSAYTNPDFARSFAREQLEFCRSCHAPALARGVEDRVAEARGVGCLDCHLRGDTLITGPGRRGDGEAAASEAPHALTRTPDFAVEGCARCHEFTFPRESWRPPGTMMQLTMSEHAESAFADRSCVDCHMPDHDHGFASTRDDAAMRRALRVEARRDGDAVELELTPVGVGHAFPTGDLHRRLELHAELVAASGQTLASATRYLGRHFPPRRHRDGRYNYAARLPTPDDRPRGPTTVRLELDPGGDPGGDAELVWWVDLERVDHRDNHDPTQSTIASEVRLAEGAIAGADAQR